MEHSNKNEVNIINRIVWIDEIKAYAIILVVIGHIIQYVIAPTNFYENSLFKIIYSFHMPLFMFVSGFLTYCPTREINSSWLKRRFRQLVIPFVVWTFIYFPIKNGGGAISLSQYLFNVINSPDWSAWFIWCLFLSDIVLFVDTLVVKRIDKDSMKSTAIIYSISIILIGFVYKLGVRWGGLVYYRIT